jgi:LPXTG-site transpeptidase (sortase) family protein
VIAMSRLRNLRSSTSARVVLSVVLVVLAIGLFAWDSDFALGLKLKLNRHDRPTYATRLQPNMPPLRSKIVGNRVVSDPVSIDSQIYGGSNSAGPLSKGVWIDPAGSTPGKGEPIVIAGHRTTHHFATLHLIERGMPVIVYWQGKEYDYIVKSVKPIEGSRGINVQKDAPGKGERLILYTCTPKWQGDKRHVVVAVPYKK